MMSAVSAASSSGTQVVSRLTLYELPADNGAAPAEEGMAAGEEAGR